MSDSIEQRLTEIERRNMRVESDKAWETSWTRRLLITAVTYIVVSLVLSRIHPEGAWVDAIIPCCGYILSTFSLPPIRALWVKLNNKNEDK